MDNVEVLTGANLSTTLMVVVALLGLYLLVCNAVDATRKLRKPKEQRGETLAEHQAECSRRFDRDFSRLGALETRMAQQEETSKVLCAGLRALLEHELHNGNADEMRKASDDLFHHLNRR